MAFNYGGYPPYGAGYNMAQPYQNQMMQSPSQMPQIPMQAQQAPAQQLPQGLSSVSRPVTNREEAVSTPADFSGSLMVFPDITHNRVYLKRWNIQTGNADFVEYAPIISANAEPQTEQAPVAFANLKDFKELQDTVDDLKKEINRLKKPASSGKGGEKE